MVTAGSSVYINFGVDVSAGGTDMPVTLNGNGGTDTVSVVGTNNGDQLHLEDAGSGETVLHSTNGTFGGRHVRQRRRDGCRDLSGPR